MAQTFYVETPYSNRHDTTECSEPHPEQSTRLNWIRQAFGDAGLFDSPSLTELVAVPPAGSPDTQHDWALGELRTVHDAHYLRKLARACMHASARYEHYLDTDTYITRDTIGVITDSVAAVRRATEQAKAAAFCAIRPPGHHAGGRFWGGFCVANFSAYARRLQIEGAEQVAIIDWDAHHGNGTQSIFYTHPSVYYLSLHANNAFPRSGLGRE